MTFEYNENACKILKDFYNEKIAGIKEEIKKLQSEKELTNEPAVVQAFAIYIQGLEYKIAELEQKIAEFDAILGAQ